MSKLLYDNVTAVSYVNNTGAIKSQIAIILPTEYGIFVLKTNSGLQQHIYQKQSTLRQISNLEH